MNIKTIAVFLYLLSTTCVVQAEDIDDFKNGMVQHEVKQLQQVSTNPDWVKKAEININLDSESKISGTLGFVKPISQDKEKIVFLQSRLVYSSNDTESHVGFGYRRILDNNQMIGFNLFDDCQSNTIVRSSVGLEYFVWKSETRVNFYFPRNGAAFQTAKGVDYQIKVQAPYLPWLSMGFKGYNWRGESKYAWNANMQVTSHLSLELQRRKGQEMYIGFTYDFLDMKHPAAFEKGKQIIRDDKIDITTKYTSKVVRKDNFTKNL